MSHYVGATDFVIVKQREDDARMIAYAGPLGIAGRARLAEAIDLCIEETPGSLDIDLRRASPNGVAISEIISSKAEICEGLEIQLQLSIGEAVLEALDVVCVDNLLSHGVELTQPVGLGSAL